MTARHSKSLAAAGAAAGLAIAFTPSLTAATPPGPAARAAAEPAVFAVEPAASLLQRLGASEDAGWSVQELDQRAVQERVPREALLRALVEHHRHAEPALVPLVGSEGGALSPNPDPSYYVGSSNLLHIDVSVSLDPTKGDMDVSAILHIAGASDSPLGELVLAVPNFPIGGVYDEHDEPLAHHRQGETLRVTPPGGALARDEVATLRIELSGKPVCTGSRLPGCRFGDGLAFVTHAHYFPRNQMSGLDLFTADLRVTVPAPYTVVGTGRLVTDDDPEPERLPREAGSSEPSGDGVEPPASEPAPTHRTFHFHHEFETYWLSFAMADYVLFEDDSGDVPLSLYVRAAQQWNAPAVLEIARSVITLFERTFSPFPFAGLDVVQIHNSFGGGYGPQATIMMAASMFELDPSSWYFSRLIQLTSHEIAHQWWGNLIFPGDNHSVGLNEGLAEFSSALHFEIEHDNRVQFARNGMSYMYTVPASGDLPMTSPFVFGSPHYQAIVYDKGCVAFDMLRHTVGEDVFYDAIEAYTSMYGRGIATMADFQEVVEVVAGRSLSQFFERWVWGTRHPQLIVAVEPSARPTAGGGQLVTVSIEQEAVAAAHPMRLDLQFELGDAARTRVDRQVRVDELSQRFTFELPAPLARLHVDPRRVWLQRTFPTVASDISMDGEVDGLDLIELARRYQRNILFEWRGGSYFSPNVGYLPRYDLNRDGLIDVSDVEMFLHDAY